MIINYIQFHLKIRIVMITQTTLYIKILGQVILPLVAVQCIGEAFDIFYLRMLKPLPIILMVLYLTESIIRNKRFNKKKQTMSVFVIIGLMFSLVGDIYLMYKSIDMFMIGTCSFLIAHLFYMWGFRCGEQRRVLSNKLKFWINVGTLGLFGLFILSVYQLFDKMPNKFLFTIYASTICFLAIFALRRYKRTNNLSYKYIAGGAFLFSCSDTLLANLKFNDIQTDLGRGVVMITYYLAQYCLMHGSIAHDNLEIEDNHKKQA